ncbi:MAG: phytase [Bacteroidales bacterium]|nr:phytase [Bacteroidales bacterium]
MKNICLIFFLIVVIVSPSCLNNDPSVLIINAEPAVITEKTPNDTDDPAIWYNRKSPENSLVLGTDKGNENGGIYVFDLDGRINRELSVTGLNRPNNIDVEYGFNFNDSLIDIAVFTERGRDVIRVMELPSCRLIDNGGIPVFEDDSLRSPMGIGLYKDNSGVVYAFVSRKSGPATGYIYQYRLFTEDSAVCGIKTRALGKFSGRKEIESIVVDDEKGYLYYSDEGAGIRKYYADAEKGNDEITLFGAGDFKSDSEGLSICRQTGEDGFLIVSDQQANRFLVYELKENIPYYHRLVRILRTKTIESDGSDIICMPSGEKFPNGLFVAMSSDRTFHYYRADDITRLKQ